jgi:hypothetical protein
VIDSIDDNGVALFINTLPYNIINSHPKYTLKKSPDKLRSESVFWES